MAFAKIGSVLKGQVHLLSLQDYQIYRFRQARSHIYHSNLRDIHFPFQPGLVSVFLTAHPSGQRPPVIPPGPTSQAYSHIEIISPADHHPIKGEFLAWVASQDLLEPELILRMVSALQQNPGWDSVSLDSLNTHPNNAAPFLARSQVAWAMGWVHPGHPTSYASYWHQADLLLNTRQVNLVSLPARESVKPSHAAELDRLTSIEQVQADFLQDFFLSPWMCLIQDQNLTPRSQAKVSELKSFMIQSGNILLNSKDQSDPYIPRLWSPAVFLQVTENPEQMVDFPQGIPENSIKVLLSLSPVDDFPPVSTGWDLCCCLAERSRQQSLLVRPWQGWIHPKDIDTFVNLLDARIHARHAQQIEAARTQPAQPKLKISIIICTYHRGTALQEALKSVAEQTFSLADYEVIIVNNDPSDETVSQVVNEARNAYFTRRPEHLRLVPCYLTGLSYARNAGISEAVGEILCFLDDDALASHTWLEHIWQAFQDHPQLGVVGGHNYLIYPHPRPRVLKKGRESYWGQLITPYKDYTEVQNPSEFPWGLNWCARKQALIEMGGFRAMYGRRKRDFSGGEEIVAASLARKLGYTVALLPAARVDHKPDPSRFTYRYLKNTMIAGIITQYRMKRDCYLSPPIAAHHLSAKSRVRTTFLSQVRRIPSKVKQILTLEYFIYALARVYLLSEQIKDTWARIQR